MNRSLGIGISLVVLFVLFSTPVYALTEVKPPDISGPITSTTGVLDLFRNILKYFAILFWIAAVGFIIYAAFLYLTSGGSPETVSKANKQLLFAVVAVAVGLLAYGVPTVVENFLKGS